MQGNEDGISTEQALEAILHMASEVLGRQVAANDNFFAVGGDSLTAVRLLMEFENFIGEEIEPDSLIDSDSFSDFAYALNLDPTA